MKRDLVISISDLFGSSVHTREASNVLFDKIKEQSCDSVELDFAGVSYISRSFADQLNFDKNSYTKTHNKIIVISNASESVVRMLQIVNLSSDARSRNLHAESIPIYKYNPQSYPDFQNFILSI